MDKENKQDLNTSPETKKTQVENLTETAAAGDEAKQPTPPESQEVVVEVQVPDEEVVVQVQVPDEAGVVQTKVAVEPTATAVKTPPKKPSGWATLGFVLSIFSFITMILTAFATFSFLAVIVYYVVIALILVLTLGLILLNEDFVEFLDVASRLEEFSIFLSKIGYYMCYGVIGLSALSITLLAVNKNYSKRMPGLVLSIVALVASVAMLAAHFFAPFGYFEITNFIN